MIKLGKKIIIIKKNKSSLKLYVFRMLIIFIFLSFILSLKNNKDNEKINLSLKKPKISIFLPIFNKERYLIRSINSIQIQSLKDIEIIAVNDCSTDNSLKLLRQLIKKDIRIKIINNDRNHGLLYSRAMGIKYSRGQYLMNLDPDDRLEGKDNLKTLYNKAKKSNLDYVRYLTKRIPRNEGEIEKYNMINKMQLEVEDFLITNKFIKKEIFLMAYNYFYKEIYGPKWNFHEDTIWKLLIQKFAKTSGILSKYIYIYKRNDYSLNMEIGSPIEIKNRIYRLKKYNKINENNNNDSYINYYKYYQYHQIMVNSCNISILKENEIKKKIIHLSIYFLKIFYNNIEIKRNINYIINKISDNKIILFFNSYNKSLIDYLPISTIFKVLQKNNRRKIISIDINNNKNNIINYIYSNDILIGIEKEIIYNINYKKILEYYKNNKIIILDTNIFIKRRNKNKFSNLTNNLIFYYSNKNKNKKKYFIPNFITYTANYFNYQKESNNSNILILYYYFDNELIQLIKNISSKYFININNINLTETYKNIINLSEIVKESELILTDSNYIMELSTLYFTSCILYVNSSQNIKRKYNLNYIKYIYNIKDLEKNLIDLKGISNNNIYNLYKNLSLNSFKIFI